MRPGKETHKMLQIGGTTVYFCQESLKKIERFLLDYFEEKVVEEETLETMHKTM